MNDFNIDGSFSTLNENKFINLVLYDSYKLMTKRNHNILISTVKIIKDSQRFDKNLLCLFEY